MATIALSVAGQFAGGLVGGPLGTTLGRALGALAGSAVDGWLFGERAEPGGSDIRLQGSSEGGAVPRLYGWSRLAGNIIWARELETLGSESRGAKGMSQPEADEVAASFAVAFCEGEVQRLGRIWADGQLLDTEGLTLRFYRGTEDQLADGLIEASQGEAPAYRGVCYLVVEQLPLGRFGNRIPQLSVELCRVVGDLERDITAVTVIPGATEFGYDPVARVQVLGRGRSRSENSHAERGRSDWTCSIDELVTLCPNLRHVALVVAWFGDDLRAGQCRIGPRVENADRSVKGTSWLVAGLGRDGVPVVSRHDGGAAYGGTPSDAAVLAAIADLKARDIAVTLYPIIMMDVPAGNGLPDPYSGGAGQGAYPWRGRITCHPAPGVAGSPDGTGVAAAQVAAFVGNGYRAMVLHYAAIAAAAGVDALLIGSEMRGLTTVRGAGNSFPFVDALVSLAAEVRGVVGPGVKLSYAADWSEYSGYQPAGEKFFHLDPLWAAPQIDAVGIDNYMPLADWRDGAGQADAALDGNGYGLEYLGGNIAGGEGFDWYYASDADRSAGLRTPIQDGAHDEPWVWRYKDIRNWWSQWHHDRPGGVRKSTPTGWVPGSKPIWFTELGCGAVDKGANQPNIFGDDKSAEGGRPYFSAGLPDPLIQRQFLRAHQRFWRDPATNPAGMVDVERIYHWTWDARPYPAFPAQLEVWSDGVNHRTGHWLTGRLGAVASDELASAIAADHGVTLTVDSAGPLVQGYVLQGATTAREALEPVLAATGLAVRNGAGGLRAGRAARQAVVTLDGDGLAMGGGPVLSRRRAAKAETPGRLALTYLDRERDYLTGTATALSRADGPIAAEAAALTLDGGGARLVAERFLAERGPERETVELALPPSALALEAGDVVALDGLAAGPFEILEIRDGMTRRVRARTLAPNVAQATAIDRPLARGRGDLALAEPFVVVAHLPGLPGDPGRTRMVAAGYAQPWPGVLSIADDATGSPVADLTRRGGVGEMALPLGMGPSAIWDRGNVLEVQVLGGHLASADPAAVQAGSNRIAVQHDDGGWEVIGFADAALLAPGHYRLRQLLRGLEGTAPGVAAAGNAVILLDGGAVTLPVEAHQLGDQRTFRVFAGPHDLTGVPLAVTAALAAGLPLAPVHLRARRQSGGAIVLDWVRRSRADGDGWGTIDAPFEHQPEAYRLTILNGDVPVRSFEVSQSSAVYDAAVQTEDLGGMAAGFDFTIAQLSPVLGAGRTARGAFDG